MSHHCSRSRGRSGILAGGSPYTMVVTKYRFRDNRSAPRQKCGLRSAATTALAVLILVGCASATPTPINSIEPLVGKWSGTLDQGGGLQLFYLTINPDATLVATWGLNWNNGTITIEKGVASYQMSPPPREGTFRYYPGGRPSLFMDDTFFSFHAVMNKGP